MGLSRVVQVKGMLICLVYFSISVVTLCLIVGAVTSGDLASMDYAFPGLYLSLVILLVYICKGDKKNKWVIAFLVAGFCETLGNKMIEQEENNQLAGSRNFLLMQIALFLESDPTGFTQGVAISFFFGFFLVFVSVGREVRSAEALHAAAVVAVAILAKATEVPDAPAYLVEGN